MADSNWLQFMDEVICGVLAECSNAHIVRDPEYPNFACIENQGVWFGEDGATSVPHMLIEDSILEDRQEAIGCFLIADGSRMGGGEGA